MTHADYMAYAKKATGAGKFTKLIGKASIHPRLEIASGAQKGLVIRLSQEEMSIGRDTLSGLCLADDAISRKQCTIKSDGGSWLLSDCNSLNGSFVNGASIREKILQHGDVIRLGSTELMFLEEEDKVFSPATPEQGNLTQCVPIMARRKLPRNHAADSIPVRIPALASHIVGVPPIETSRVKLPASLSQLAKAIRKRRWILVAFIGAAVVAALVVQFAAPKLYEASALVKIERDNAGAIDGQDASHGSTTSEMDRIITTQIEMAHSEPLLRPIAEKYHLASTYRPADANLESMGEPTKAPLDLKGLSVSRLPNSYLIRISYRAHNPQLAADVANAVARSLTTYVNDCEKRSNEQISAMVTQEMAALRTKMDKSAAQLANFDKHLNMADPSEGAAISTARLTQLNSEYIAAQAERMRREAILAELNGNASLASVETTQAASKDTLLHDAIQRLNTARQQFAQVRSFYGEAHPEYTKAKKQVEELQAQVDELQARAKDSAKAEYHQALNRENLLQGSVQQAKAELDRLEAVAHQYGQLQGDAEHDKKIYEDIALRARIAEMNRRFQQATIEIAAPALVPQLQVFPRLFISLPVALIVSCLLGIFFIFFLDTIDSTFSDSEDVVRRLHIDVLAAIPAASPSPMIFPDRMAEQARSRRLSRVQPCYDEAIRSARTAISLANSDRPIRSVLVTSAMPGEGKSTVATELALSFAQLGRRVLLIDANFRHPALHQFLNEESATGLADVLKGTELSANAIRRSGQPGLFVIPAGPLPQRATDLISTGFSKVLLRLRREFDWIIVDAPHVLGASEAQELASAVDGVLLLTKANATSAKQLSEAVSAIGKSGANLIGIVINQVKLATAALRTYSPESYAANTIGAVFLGK